ncbi:MAG: hypothetical protein MUC67_08290 [Acidobacteria bacterium]|nr:hypothetical protein [Acidobacteriota bacterium]
MQSRSRMKFVVAAAVALLAVFGARAEETKGRWRLEFAVGGYSPVDTIPSAAANVQTGFDGTDLVNVFDPRPDEFGIYEAGNAGGPRVDFRASYGLASFDSVELVISGGVGFFQSKIESLEFSYSLDRLDPSYVITIPPEFPGGETKIRWVPGCESLPVSQQKPSENCQFFYNDIGGDQFNSSDYETWKTELINPATLNVYPVSVDVLARFRPTKRFNPYLGAGLGYYIVSQQSSERWREIQDQLDASFVTYVQKVPGSLVLRTLEGEGPDGAPRDMKRPEIDSPNSLFAQLRGGAEWQWRQKTAFFFEALFAWAKDNVEITSDGRPEWGRATPTVLFRDPFDPDAFPFGGLPAYITQGGIKKKLVDSSGQSLGDGPWPGEYYLNGGTLDYGGWSFSFGVRFTL